MPGYVNKMMYGTGGSNMEYGKGGQKGGQALFDALKKKGYKRIGGPVMGNTMGNASLESSMNGMTYKCGGAHKRKIMDQSLRKR